MMKHVILFSTLLALAGCGQERAALRSADTAGGARAAVGFNSSFELKGKWLPIYLEQVGTSTSNLTGLLNALTGIENFLVGDMTEIEFLPNGAADPLNGTAVERGGKCEVEMPFHFENGVLDFGTATFHDPYVERAQPPTRSICYNVFSEAKKLVALEKQNIQIKLDPARPQLNLCKAGVCVPFLKRN
jgi:hypothetical protein